MHVIQFYCGESLFHAVALSKPTYRLCRFESPEPEMCLLPTAIRCRIW